MHSSHEPKVSICIVTYNHEQYIGQCLQSLVDQATDFDFEIIVGNDCSTDGTFGIVQEFAERYPGIIRPVHHEVNIGASRNYHSVHSIARGQYVAHLDGDDYALPGKLQKQADFLDQYEHCSFVCHYMHIVSEDGSKTLGIKPNGRFPRFTDLEKLVTNYVFFSHSSKMYRKSADRFDHSQENEVIDFTYHVEHASSGPIGFIPEVLGCYRQNGVSITKSTGEKLYKLFDLTLKGIERARDLGVAENVVHNGRTRYLIGAAVFCLLRDDLVGFKKYLQFSVCDGKYYSKMHALMFKFQGWPFLLKLFLNLRNHVLSWARKLRS